jgi:hypothetical protein
VLLDLNSPLNLIFLLFTLLIASTSSENYYLYNITLVYVAFEIFDLYAFGLGFISSVRQPFFGIKGFVVVVI